MKTFIFLIFIILIQTDNSVIFSQEKPWKDFIKNPEYEIPYEFNKREWKDIQKTWFYKSLPVQVTFRDNSAENGQILGIEDNILYLWTDEHSMININESGKYLHRISLDQVTSASPLTGLRIRIMRSGIIWGSLISGTVGILVFSNGWTSPFYGLLAIPPGAGTGYLIDKHNRKKHEMVPDTGSLLNLSQIRVIKKYSFYNNNIPTFMRESAYQGNSGTADNSKITFENVISGSSRAERAFRESEFLITSQVGFALLNNFNKHIHRTYGLNLKYNLSDLFNIDYELRLYEPFDVWKRTNSGQNTYIINSEHFDKTGHFIHFNYSFLTSGTYSKKGINVSAGVNLSFNQIDYGYRRSYEYITYSGSGDDKLYYSGEFEDNLSKLGFGFGTRISFYIFNRISLSLNGERNFMKPFNLKGYSVVLEEPEEILSFQTVEINPSSFDLMLGLTCHF